MKKGVRYDYYVSAPAIQGRKHDSGSICRVPAKAIEGTVTDALRARSRPPKSPDPRAGQSENALFRDIQRVEVHFDRILIKLRASDTDRALDKEHYRDVRLGPSQELQIPWTRPLSRRKRDIILPLEAKSKSEIKPLRNEERLKLLRAIVTARGWRDALLPVAQEGVDAIAARHGKSESWVRKHLTLAFLDPKLVEAAVDGSLPRGYGLSRFLDLPADWDTQWSTLHWDTQWSTLGLRNPRH